MVYYLKSLFLVLLAFCTCLTGFAQVSICSWNLENFGRSKSEEDIVFIASSVRNFDIIAVEEVMDNEGGTQAIARLCDALNKTGAVWQYQVSAATSSYENMQQKERYAFLWKRNKVFIKGKGLLHQDFEKEIEREPFIATFEYQGKEFSIAAFHALPKKKQPETEIKYLRYFKELGEKVPIIFLGDFNCPQSHTVFLPLKNKGYSNALQRQKTTLKQECKDGECLASEYDNIFYPAKKMKLLQAGVIPFYKSFAGDMKKARKLSDHLPVFAEFSLN